MFHTVAPLVFSQVDMFHAIAAAARGGHHFIYTVYLCVIASYIVKLNDAFYNSIFVAILAKCNMHCFFCASSL